MTPPDAHGGERTTTCEPGPNGSCALCADEAIPGRVALVHDATGTADVELGGRITLVALDLVDGVAVGDVVLVHQGFAISRMELP